jgi:hypothetical protein
MAFAVDGASAPNIVNSSVARTREYLTANEVEDLWRPPANRAGTGIATLA